MAKGARARQGRKPAAGKAGKGRSAAKSSAGKGSKRPRAVAKLRLPRQTAVRLRLLARKGANLDKAAAEVGLEVEQLTAALADRPKLAEAWARGRLLHDVEQLARTGASYEEAAGYLETPAADFEALVTTDPQLRDVWQRARIGAVAAVAAKLYQQATEGSVRAVQSLLSRLSRDTGRPEVNFSALGVSETATAMGVSRQTIHAWARKGAPRNADGSFHLPALCRWRVDQAVLEVGPASGDGSEADPLRAVKARRLTMELAAETGRLLDRSSVIAGLANRARHQAAALDADAVALSARLEGKTRQQIQRILTDRFAVYRRRLADVPAELKLPPAAERRLGELLADLAEPKGAETP